jgi:hypothetical protein
MMPHSFRLCRLGVDDGPDWSHPEPRAAGDCDWITHLSML